MRHRWIYHSVPLAALVWVALFAGCSLFAPAPPEVVQNHLQRYPEMQVEDAYKLLYHRHMGPAHAEVSLDNALRYLHDEVKRAQNLPHAIPLIERLDGDSIPFQSISEHDGHFVRLYLGPFVNQGGDLQELALAFVRSAEAPSDTTALLEEWGQLKRAAKWRDVGNISRAALDSLEAELAPLNWPAVHHSATYKRLYQPHYRVLTVQEALQLREHLPERSMN